MKIAVGLARKIRIIANPNPGSMTGKSRDGKTSSPRVKNRMI